MTVVIDCTGKLCVALLLELRRHIAGLTAGTVVHVIATDPATPLDLPAWCHMIGYDYLGVVAGQAQPTYAFQLTAGARSIHPSRPWHTE